MRYLILAILFVFFGCGGEDEKHSPEVETWMALHNIFQDSADFYFIKTDCLLECGFIDSAIVMNERLRFFNDSVFYYYKLVYPNDRPVINVTEQDMKEAYPKGDCNCY